MSDAINNCYENIKIIKDNKEKEQRIFFYLDEYSIFRKVLTEEFIKTNNINEIGIFFNNRSYEHRFDDDERINKKLKFKYYPNEQLIEEIEKIERIAKVKKYKPVLPTKIEDDILTDNKYDETNWNYDYLYNKVCNIVSLKEKKTINYLKNDFCELNYERKTNLVKLSFMAGSSFWFKCNVNEWYNFIKNNIHICNSDNKYNEYQIKDIITKAFIKGKEKQINELKNVKYTQSERYCSNIKKVVDALIIDLELLLNNLYYEEDENALKRNLRLHKRSNPRKNLILNIKNDMITNDGKNVESLITSFLLRNIDKSSLTVKELDKIESVTKLHCDRALKFIYQYQEKLENKRKEYDKIVERNEKLDKIKKEKEKWLNIKKIALITNFILLPEGNKQPLVAPFN